MQNCGPVVLFRERRRALLLPALLLAACAIVPAQSVTFRSYELAYGSTTGGITVGPDGALWFTQPNPGTIGRITTAGAIIEYPVSPAASPYGITVGSDGALWFTGRCGGRSIAPPSRPRRPSSTARPIWAATSTIFNSRKTICLATIMSSPVPSFISMTWATRSSSRVLPLTFICTTFRPATGFTPVTRCFPTYTTSDLMLGVAISRT